MRRFPAEWEKQSAILIAWPHQTGDFIDVLESVEKTYVVIAKTITRFEPLIIVCHDDNHQQRIKKLIGGDENIYFIQAAINDTWVRDTVFLTVENNGAWEFKNFRFNGWGNKYLYHEDDALNHKLLPHSPFLGANHQDIDFVLEGGSLESDGRGTLLTTRQCLLNPNRNPNYSQLEIEGLLAEHFGATRILWLDQESLDGDDTDAHIDTLARFCSDTHIAYTSCESADDHHYLGLKDMEMQLQALRKADGERYQLIPLPLPKPIYSAKGERLPANYANFLIINNAVLVPTYDDPMDHLALERIAGGFPDRQVIAVPSRPLVEQYGSLHCMTMQFPEKALCME